MKATLPSGDLIPIKDCYIAIPELNITIPMKLKPDISDSKSASYPDEGAIGRSMPFKSYQNSETRTISWTAHFIICKNGDADEILKWMRILQACTYPRSENTGGSPYAPPPICKLRCGELLSSKNAPDVCCILKSYSVKHDIGVPWDAKTYMAYKFDVDLQFEVVYNQADLPGMERIMVDGY